MSETEHGALSYISKNVEKVFPGLTLVGVEESLAEGYTADLHLKDSYGDDVVVEVRTGRLGKNDVGRMISVLSLIENVSPPLRKVKLMVVADSIGVEERRILNDFGIRFSSYSRLGVTKARVAGQLRGKLLNVPTGVESRLMAHLNGGGCAVVNAKHVEDRFNLNREYSSKLLERLEKKRYLERVMRGKYIYIPVEYGYEERFPPMNPLIVGGALDDPYYFGYFTANALHGFTAQLSPRVYVCSGKPRRPIRWRGTRYLFVSLVDRKFFGYVNRDVDGCTVHVADPEKAVIDSVDKPEYCGGVQEVVAVMIRAIEKGIDLEKLAGYAARMGSNAAAQRLGYLAETLEKSGFIKIDGDFIERIRNLIPEKAVYSYLGTKSVYGREGSYNRRWRVVDNVPRERLLGEVEVR